MGSIAEELKLETLMTLSFLPSKRILVIHQNKDSRKRSSSRAHVTCQGLASIRDSIIDFRPLLFSKGLNNLNYILYLALLMNGLKVKQFHELFRFRKNIQNSCVRIVKKKFSRIYLWNRHISWTKKGGGGRKYRDNVPFKFKQITYIASCLIIKVGYHVFAANHIISHQEGVLSPSPLCTVKNINTNCP